MAEYSAQMRQRMLRNMSFPPGSEERASLDAIGVPTPDPILSGGARPFVPVPGFVYPTPFEAGRVDGSIKLDPSDDRYAYQDLGDGSYAVFRDGRRTGTARRGSRAADSIANVLGGGRALSPMSERERRLEASLASHDLAFERPVVEDRAPMSFAEYSRTPEYQQALAQRRSDEVEAGLPPRSRALSKL